MIANLTALPPAAKRTLPPQQELVPGTYSPLSHSRYFRIFYILLAFMDHQIATLWFTMGWNVQTSRRSLELGEFAIKQVP